MLPVVVILFLFLWSARTERLATNVFQLSLSAVNITVPFMVLVALMYHIRRLCHQSVSLWVVVDLIIHSVTVFGSRLSDIFQICPNSRSLFDITDCFQHCIVSLYSSSDVFIIP